MRITDENGKLIKAVAHRVSHGFRRTAVRNLERAGVPRSAAMKMVGHKTEAICWRYATPEEKMLTEAPKHSTLDQQQTETAK
jgi:integrase